MIDIAACPDYPALQQLTRALWRSGGGRGAAILVGAGLSRTARLAGGNVKRPPLWFDLATAMTERLYPGEHRRGPSDPLRLAEEFRTYFGQAALDELLRSMIDDSAWSPSEVHRALLALPWSDVLTTNYDTLLERAARQTDREYQPVLAEADLAHAQAPRIVKLHGSMGASTSFVIAEEDYRTYPARHAAFVNLARQVFVENELVLVGFSGDDPNFSAWAGWVRDHLGSTARRIYLAGALDLGPAKRKFLEARNIAPIDLYELVRDVDPSVMHTRAVEILFEHFASQEPVPAHRWSPVSRAGLEPSLDRDPAREADRFGLILEGWKEERLLYPGWVVCPGDLRQQLRNSVDQAPFNEAVLALMKPERAAAAVVEVCWRHRVALWPLHNADVELVERTVDLESGDLLSLEDRLTIATTLARQLRFDGNNDRFERIAELVSRIAPSSSDALAEIAYLRAEKACLDMRFEEAVRLAQDIAGDDPFWGVRHAAILVEAGCQIEAATLLRDTLGDLRDRQRSDRGSIWIGSRLAWTEMMIRADAHSRFEFVPWSERHQLTRCDPFVEVARFRERLMEQRRDEPISGRTPLFRPGSFTDHSRTVRFRSWSNLDPFVELDLMLIDGGAPPRLENVSLFAAERLDALLLMEDEAPYAQLHLLRLVDAADKSLGRHWSRLRIARLAPGVVADLTAKVEKALAYWMKRVTAKQEPVLFADGRMRLYLRALARLALRLDADNAIRLYRSALGWLRLFPGPARQDVMKELLTNTWEAIPGDHRDQLVADTLALPLMNRYLGVEPAEWLLGTSVAGIASDPRREGWVKAWTDAMAASEELRASAALRLLYLRSAGALTPVEEAAFVEALWAQMDDGAPPMPDGTNLRISYLHDLKRRDTLDPAEAVRERLFAASETIPEWRLIDIRGAIEAKRLLPTRAQAADLFDRLCTEDPPRVAEDPLSRLDANFSGYDRRHRQRLVSVALAAVGSTLDPADLSQARADALVDFVYRTGAIAAISALACWPATPGRLAEIVATAKKALRSSASDDVADGVDVLLRWETSLGNAPPPEELRDLAEAVISGIEYRRTHAIWHLLRAARRLLDGGLASASQNERLAMALLELLPEWDYASIAFGSEEAGMVSLVRSACARLAKELRRLGVTSEGVEAWLVTAPLDPLPEVRYAADMPD